MKSFHKLKLRRIPGERRNPPSVSELRQLARALGLMVWRNSHIDALEKGQKGLLLLHQPSGKYHLIYDDQRSPQDQWFTIAHEIGHYMLGHLDGAPKTGGWYSPSSRSEKMERDADAFAVALLAGALLIQVAPKPKKGGEAA